MTAFSSKIHSKKHLKERKLRGDSVVSALIPELLRAQRCINKLKAEHNSSKKKLKQLVRNLEEEKILWKHREAQKIQAILDELKDKLAREKRSRERMELLNTKLLHELAEAKLYAKKFMIKYEEEKKERELMEQVCNELAMQIGEDKAKLEGLQKDFMDIREEVEEERKMFQMAGLWREESMQMKLVDAKLALEDKYNQMIQLIAYMQDFLRSRGDELDTMKSRDAQLIKQAAESVNVQCIKEELSYDFSKSNENFPIYEELRKGKINERAIKADSLPSSTIHIVSFDEDYLNNYSVLHQPSTSSDYGCYKHRDSVAQHNSEDLTFDECKGRFTTGSSFHSGGITSTFMCKGSGEGGFKRWELLGQRNSTDTMNPHITRGIKGCIEWPRPRGISKTNSKAISLEERVRKQKSQLQLILKQQA
ncbi:uncharacterized protein LOC133291334 [Gastrolobium bilobum]|uniref:uncharacterized protein LOC133291334 n=1 Tax=Gastrolobium bilobum TaxID=150636 RepID=UPI002AB0F64A|nr:uncharacterized protein LOC133291334 [Gastrolobium bilobum]